MGSKSRIAKEILPIILKDRKPEQWYVEPFVGGCNSLDKVDGNRIASDTNKYIISMWKAVQSGWIPPRRVDREQYNYIKNNKEIDSKLTGWVGIACSYSGKWFGGYAGNYPISRIKKNGVLPNYQDESYNTVIKQVSLLKNVVFYNLSYEELPIPSNSIIYCDPPYANTTKYKDSFGHKKFWLWCEKMVHDGHTVFVSEYNAPSNWISVWEGNIVSQLSANGRAGGNKFSVEKLFKLR